jgi:hypothetical protein
VPGFTRENIFLSITNNPFASLASKLIKVAQSLKCKLKLSRSSYDGSRHGLAARQTSISGARRWRDTDISLLMIAFSNSRRILKVINVTWHFNKSLWHVILKYNKCTCAGGRSLCIITNCRRTLRVQYKSNMLLPNSVICIRCHLHFVSKKSMVFCVNFTRSLPI